jgi:exodeoxyribonuclease-3
MRIATWNVNSVKARLPVVLDVLKAIEADVVVFQEIKCETHAFPRLEIEDMGYNCHVVGQKSYNGVALLSRYPIEDVIEALPGDQTDAQARYVEAFIAAPRPLRVGGLYLPNGNPVGTEKFDYKLGWMDRLNAHARTLIANEEPFVLLGDYNIIPTADDCWDAKVWEGDALFRPESRSRWRELLNLGLTSAYEACDGRSHQYTFWDYQAGAWAKDHGIRIDHAVLSPDLAERLVKTEIYREARGMEKPSDHVPVIITLAD